MLSIFWLILKIVGIVIGCLLGIFLLIIVGTLFLPISYKIQGKYIHTLTYDICFRIFGFISILVASDEEELVKVKIFGKTMRISNSSSIKEREIKDSVKEEVQKEIVLKQQTIDIKNEQRRKVKSNKKKVKKAHKIKETKKQSFTQKMQKYFNLFNKVWKDANRDAFIKTCLKTLKAFFKALKPQYFWFRIKFGLENPADTGLWLAKLMVIYPFYAPIGRIEADFQKQVFEGEIKAIGKTNVFKLIRPFIAFALKKEVRQYIKLLMHIGKEDKNGIKAQ